MSIAKPIFFLLGLGASQWLAQPIQYSLPPQRCSSWCWGFLAQYAVCVLLLYFVDGNSVRKSLEGAITIILIVRFYYFFRSKNREP